LQRKFNNTDGAEINTNVTFILVTTTITKQKTATKFNFVAVLPFGRNHPN
jgi:hypothetical protein